MSCRSYRSGLSYFGPIPCLFQNAMFRPLTLKLKVNEDNWNDEQRIRVSVVRVEPTDLVKESRVRPFGGFRVLK